MQTTKEDKDAKDVRDGSGGKHASHEFTPKIRESLIEQAKATAEENRRVEMNRLKEDVDALHALLASLEPKEQERLAQALTARQGTAMTPAISVAAVGPRPFPPTLPIVVIDYQMMRPPFTPDYAEPIPRSIQACYDVPNFKLSSLLLRSEEPVPELGALSILSAIGEVSHQSCGSGGTGLFGWWENSASAFMTFVKQPRVRVSSQTQLVVEVDYAVEGPAQFWACFMIPGEAGGQLGLVGALGMANMSVSANIQGTMQLQKTYERFLLGSASAHFPAGQIELKQIFTLTTSHMIPSGQTLNWYQIHIDAQVSTFKSDGLAGKYHGYAQSNLTLPGTATSIGPSAPLKVKEIRTALISL